MALAIGDRAPDFELPAVHGDQRFTFRLSDHLGKQLVVVCFYPLDWSPVCSIETVDLQRALPDFEELNAKLIAISVDSTYSHIAWQEMKIGKVGYPLVSDFFPHGQVAAAYGVLRSGEPVPGISERAVFIIGLDGKIAFAKVYHLGEQPNPQELLDVLKGMGKSAPASAAR